jgi:hypothetical protein
MTAASLGGAGAIALTSAPPASASALGCAGFARFHVDGIPIYGGNYCFGVWGSGSYVNFTDGDVNTPMIYNRSEVVRFYDSHGSNYATYWGPTSYGWTYGYHYWRTGIHGNFRSGGRVCGTLLSSGHGVATVCHGIS